MQAGSIRSVIDWIEQRKQFAAAIAVTEQRKGNHRPDSAMRVLPTILAHTGRIALDVTRIQFALVEWRSEKQDDAIAPADQVLINRSHCPHGSMRLRSSRDNAPGLGNRVDLAFTILR